MGRGVKSLGINPQRHVKCHEFCIYHSKIHGLDHLDLYSLKNSDVFLCQNLGVLRQKRSNKTLFESEHKQQNVELSLAQEVGMG